MPEQEARYEGDAWEEPIRKFLNGKAQVTVVDIAGGALGFEIERPNFLSSRGTSTRHAERPSIVFGIGDARRVGAVLTDLGLEAGQTRSRNRTATLGKGMKIEV